MVWYGMELFNNHRPKTTTLPHSTTPVFFLKKFTYAGFRLSSPRIPCRNKWFYSQKTITVVQEVSPAFFTKGIYWATGSVQFLLFCTCCQFSSQFILVIFFLRLCHHSKFSSYYPVEGRVEPGLIKKKFENVLTHPRTRDGLLCYWYGMVHVWYGMVWYGMVWYGRGL